MESFRWGPQFETGIAEVDGQHQSLVAMINKFGEAFTENTIDSDFLLHTFSELAEYAQNHFDTEEQLMTSKRLDLRHLKHHLGQHNDFVTEISNLAASISPDKPEGYRSLFEYLTHWLVYHILGADKNMARQIFAMDGGASASDAYNQLEKEASSSTEPLLTALNSLFILVSKRNKSLLELNRTLEARVAERTRELTRANAELEIISVTDHLTQLPNRRFAMGQLALLWSESKQLQQPLGLLMIDADGFKQINDRYGHDAGDTVLQELAKELRYAVRSDDIVCRLGGDEFVIICPNTDLEGVLHLGEQTRARIAKLKVQAGEGFWPGSLSIGAASTGSHTTDIQTIDALIKKADEAVYRAKEAGKNCVRS